MSAAPQTSYQTYTCTFPGCPAPVKVDLAVIRSLETVVRETTEDRQGILYGDARPGGSEVRGSRPLPAFGVEEIRAAISAASEKAIGYYRIRSGNALELSAQEVSVADELFHNPGSVVLLVERRAAHGEGCFFFLENGALLNLPLLRFPFDSAVLGRVKPQAVAKAQKEEKRESPAPVADG